MYFWWGLCTFGGVLFFATYLWWGRKSIVLLVGSHRTFGGFELFSVLLVGSHRTFGGFELFSVLLMGSHRTSLAFTSPAFVSLAFVSLAIVSRAFVSLAFVSLVFVSLAFVSLAFVLPIPFFAPGVVAFPPSLLHLHSSCSCFTLHSACSGDRYFPPIASLAFFLHLPFAFVLPAALPCVATPFFAQGIVEFLPSLLL